MKRRLSRFARHALLPLTFLVVAVTSISNVEGALNEIDKKKIAEWRTSIRKMEERMASIQATVPDAKRVSEALESQAASLKERIDEIEKRGNINEFREEDVQIEALIAQLSSSIKWGMEQITVFQEGKGREEIKDTLSYVVSPMSLVPILPDTYPVPGKLSSVVSIVAVPGEYEPGSFVLRPISTDIKQMRMTPSDLKSETGKIIPSSSVDIKIVKCWYQADGAWILIRQIDKTAKVLVPEMLLNDDSLVKVDYEKQANYLKLKYPGGEKHHWISDPAEHVPSEGRRILTIKEFPVMDSRVLLLADIQKGRNKQFWITVKVPEGSSPGIYRGEIALVSGERPLGTIELKLRVLPFRLSPPKTRYDLSKEFTGSLYYRGVLSTDGSISGELKTEQQFRHELEDLYRHGVTNPIVYSGGSLAVLEKMLKMRQQVGMGGQPLYHLLGAAENPSIIKGVVGLAKSYGIPGVYFYGIDEAPGELQATQRPAWKATHAAGGKIFVAGTSDDTFKHVGDVLDLMIGGTTTLAEIRKDPLFQPSKEAEKWHGAGSRLWAYGYPAAGVGNPEPHRRKLGLLIWKANFDGKATYAYHDSFGNIWNDFDHPAFRDIAFTYPTVDGTISTIAWEAYREGTDDIRYATTLMLEILRVKKEGDEERKRVALEAEKYLDEFDVEVGDLDGIRFEIIQYILRLRGETPYENDNTQYNVPYPSIFR